MPKAAAALRRRKWRFAVGPLLLLPSLCLATDVRVIAITPGLSADVVIDCRAPITLEVGDETPEGVRLLRVDRDRAVLRVDGTTKTLSLVAERGVVDGAPTGSSVILSTDARGQFSTRGYVNGRPVVFVVDTGASVTTLSTADARRIRLDYRQGAPAKAVTVNGVVNGWRVSLDSVQIGDLTVHDVAAIVVDNDTLPVVLLGMTFLSQFDMHRQGATLVLRRRR